MAIPLYLAKTAAEFASTAKQPDHLAWMACHFSPYGTGLTNLPSNLPENTLLILNDRTPVHAHDPARVKDTLEEIAVDQNCNGILLDLQRPNCPETVEIVSALLSLPCPVCVSDLYAKELDCPVFLPPVPLTCTAEEYLAPWSGREIWLEVSTQHTNYTVTETGSAISPCPEEECIAFHNDQLNLHYRIDIQDHSAIFRLHRNHTDLADLLEEASSLGVTRAIGLWQELKNVK